MNVSFTLEQARVASATRGIYTLWTQAGAECRGTLNKFFPDPPAIGDWVMYDPETSYIHEVLPRKTALMRKKVGRATEQQVIAANVDIMFIVMALDGDFNLRRLERYLVVAEESGATPVVVLNKSDLCEDLVARLSEVDALTQAAVVVMSAIDATGVLQLSRHIEPEQTGALLGSSGVGKSTIINALLGDGRQTVAAVREADGKGRHTTTHREMFRLSQGWILIDMPGMRELEPWATTDSVSGTFGDIEALAAKCRFRDCTHHDEPGCNVAGQIDAVRLASFHKLFGEMDEQARKRRGKIGCRAVRQILETNPKHWRNDES